MKSAYVRVVAPLGGLVACALFPSAVSAQLRVATWNISNFNETSDGTSARENELRTAVFGSFNGRSMTPDVLMVQEVGSQASANYLLGLLNSSPGQSGAWATTTFNSGSDSAIFYRTSKVSGVTPNTIAFADPGTTGQPRDTMRFDLTLAGYAGAAPVVSMYSVHLKAGDGTADQQRRLVETQRIRNDAASLPGGRQFLVGGDFNVQRANEASYQALVNSSSSSAGRLYDPINSAATWNENSTYRFIHTQDPSGTGGMDDRHDQILLGGGLIDGKGFDYIGNPNVAYSTSTWNDPNHSYRAWGNDGSSYDTQLTTTGNTMVGSTIAGAIKTVTTTAGGHLPVFLDLRVAEELATSAASLNFGLVQQGDEASQSLGIFNSVDAAVWTSAGVAHLQYTLAARGDVLVPTGNFTDAAGGASNLHEITLDTTTLGLKSGFVDIHALDGALLRSIEITGTVIPEPTTAAMLLLGMSGLLIRRRRP